MNQRARKMTGAQWATMVLYRLMLPICPDLEGKTCQCGQKMDAFGHHAHACKLNKLRHQQHNTVQYEFQKCFNDLEMNATLAWAGMYPNTPGKKWDLVVQNCPLYPALSVGIDFSITTPCCTSYVNAAQNPGGAAKARANVKNNKYLPAPQEHTTSYVYDSFNPEARRFVWEQMREGYQKYGIKTFWLDAEEPEVGLLCPTGRLCWEPYDSMAKVPPCCHCPGSAPARAQGGAWRL